MTFLAPLFLCFGAAALVPLFLHLYQRRKRTVLEFSTNRFFTVSLVRAQRRLRIRRILLLLLRMAACIFIALAVAQPILRLFGGAARPGNRDVVILLDDSLSMQASGASVTGPPAAAGRSAPSDGTVMLAGGTRFDRAKSMAAEILRHLSNGDRAALVTFTGKALGTDTRSGTVLTSDMLKLEARVRDLSVTSAAGDAGAALHVAAQLLEGSGPRARVVIALSDLQASDWPRSPWPQPHQPIDLLAVNLGPPPAANLAIDALLSSPPAPRVGQSAKLSVRLLNYGNDPAAAQLVLRVDGIEQARRPVELPPHATPIFQDIPFVFDHDGDHRLSAALECRDPLEADNTRYAAVHVTSDLSVLLIDGQNTAPRNSGFADRSPGFFLRAALATADAPGAGRHGIHVESIDPVDLPRTSLEPYRVVVMSDVRDLPLNQVERLEEFVRAGGGLAVFLGEQCDAKFYNEMLCNPARPLGGVLPAHLDAIIGADATGATNEPMHIVRAETDHPVLQAYRQNLRGALAGIDVFKVWQVHSPDAAALATLDHNLPLLLEHLHGRGRSVLCTTSPTPAWSNLASRPSFVAIVNQLIDYLAGGGSRTLDHEVGRELTLLRGGWDGAEPASVTLPDGKTINSLLRVDGVEPVAFLPGDLVAQPGFYTVKPPRSLRELGTGGDSAASMLLAVNVPRRESDPEPLDGASAVGRAQAWRLRIVGSDPFDPGALLNDYRAGRGVWDALLWCVLLAVLVEPLIANQIWRRRSGQGRGCREPRNEEQELTMHGWHAQLAGLTVQPTSMGVGGAVLIMLGMAAVVAAYTLGLRGPQHSWTLRMGLLMLRLTAAICILVALLHPSWVRQFDQPVKPVVAVVLDDSQSMAQLVADGAGSSKPVSRYDRARDVLAHKLLPELSAGYDVRLFDVQGRPLEGPSVPVTPAGPSSPLVATLVSLERDLARQNLAGIVLLSDGLDTHLPTAAAGSADAFAPDPGRQTADASLESLRVPVSYLDLFGADAAAGPPDLAIASVAANRRALVGNNVEVTVDIAAFGKAEDLTVPLSILEGNRPVASRLIHLRAGEPGTRAQIEFAPRRAGRFVYTLHLGAAEGETNLANNVQTFPLVVRAKALTVLYIDGVLRWEGKFTRQALTADPDLNVVSSVRTAPPAAPGAGPRSPGLLLAEQLAHADAVILGDIEATYFSSEEIEALRKWVTEDGGGLLVTGGYRSFGPEGFGRTALRDILPIVTSDQANAQIEQPFNLKLTEAGSRSAIFHLSDDRSRDTAFFQSLPKLEGCIRIAGIKPAAQVLAVDPLVSAADGSAGLPVMVTQQVGLGRVMVFSVDTTWRWRTIVGGFTGDASFYQRFWGQLARWLASGEEENGRNGLMVSTDHFRYRQGQTIELTAQAPQHDGAGPKPTWNMTAQGLDESGGRLSVPLAPVGPPTDNRYRGNLAAGHPGRLDLTVTAEPLAAAANPPPASRSALLMAQSQVITVQVDPPDPESQPQRPDAAWLRHASQLTGGQAIAVDKIADWAAGLPRQNVVVTQTQATALWSHPGLISIFLGLLCVEWIWRRWARMA